MKRMLAIVALLCAADAGAAASGGALQPVSPGGRHATQSSKKPGGRESLVSAADEIDYAISAGDDGREGALAAFSAVNPANALRASFSGAEVRVHSTSARAWQVGLKLQAYGYGDAVVGATPGMARAAGNRVEIVRGSSGMLEWYVNTSSGLEQGFTLSAPPVGRREPATGPALPLRIVLDLTGDLRGEVADDGHSVLLHDGSGRHVSTYDHLVAWDATGRELPARMAMIGTAIALEVDDTSARYPVTVDPTLWQIQATLVAETGAAFDEFGGAVAISGDRAIVGAVESYPLVGGSHLGAAYIFVRSGATWDQEAKLVPSDGVPFAYFGFQVAIDGNTAVVGAPSGGDQSGEAYVFVRNASGEWREEARLFAPVPTAYDKFGRSVAISGDDVIVGTYQTGVGRTQGAAYAFSRSNGAWSAPVPLVPNDSAAGDIFGFAVAISGGTAIVGAPGKSIQTRAGQGAAYAFKKDGAAWPQEGPALVGSGGLDQDLFGGSVGIGGNTAILQFRRQLNVGDRGAYFFTRTAGVWTEQQKISEPNATSHLGVVGISGDSAIIGTSIYTRSGNGWSEQTKLTSPSNPGSFTFGIGGVATSGETAIIGDAGEDVETHVNQGAAFAFLRSPDTDEDGLPDDWETNGVSFDGVFLDLPAMGADPRHKDIFVHVEWMQPDPARPNALFRPMKRAMDMVTAAFAAAPVKNPDHGPGIRLHIDLGPDSVMNPLNGAKWGVLSRAGQEDLPYEALTGVESAPDVYDWTAIEAIKARHFMPASRSAVFHYALFMNTQPGLPVDSSGNSRDMPGPDFFVSLGHPNYMAKFGIDPATATSIGTELLQASTFMHELGHNLGLRHGGFENKPNKKPNYISVMNYAFQLSGLLKLNGTQREIDYSRTTLPPLDEDNLLKENDGIDDPAMHLTFWICPPPGDQLYNRKFYPSKALDWNLDGVRSATPIGADINCNGRREELVGFADWPELVFDGGGRIGEAKGAGTELQVADSGEASLDELLSSVPQYLLDEEAAAPHDETTVMPQFGSVPLTVAFDGRASTAVNATIADWRWDFGDDTTGTGSTTTHTYDTPGTYFASLTVTDSNGRVNLVPLQHVITAEVPPTPTPTPVPTLSPRPTRTPAATASPAGPTPTAGATPIGGFTPTPTPSATPAPTPVLRAGDLDPTFDATATTAGGTVNVVRVQPDGRILIAGDFKAAAGCARRNIARLLPNGSCDPSFDSGLVLTTDEFRVSTAFSSTTRLAFIVYAMELQPDGRILVGVQSVFGFKGNVPGRSRMLFRLNADGSLDPSFDVGDQFANTNTQVNAIALRPDGRIVIGGAFLYAGPAHQRSGVARLLADGTIDPTFAPAPGDFYDGPSNNGGTSPGGVTTLALQSDGHVVISGFFTSVGTVPQTAIARLGENGAFDPGFNVTNPATGLPSSRLAFTTAIRAIAVVGGDKLVVGGYLTDAATAVSFPFAKLNADGSRDDTFSTAVGSRQVSAGTGALALAVQSDGKIVAVGHGLLTTAQGVPSYVLRLNEDGTLDATYDTGVNTLAPPLSFSAQPYIESVALQANGEAIIAGSFDYFNGELAEEVLRLNTDGGRDPAFNSTAGSDARVLALVGQPDGKLLVGVYADGVLGVAGSTPRTRLNSTRLGGIGRLNADGSTDTTFVSPFDQSFIATIVPQPDGRILVAGSIRQLGSPTDLRYTRLLANGAIDTSFHPPAGVGGPSVVQPDGKIITSEFISPDIGTLVRVDATGGRDATFSRLLGRGAFASLLIVQADTKILIGGSFFLPDGRPAAVARLKTDGSFDPDFVPGAAPDGQVYAMLLQPDGKIVIAGSFTTVDGVARAGIARLTATGALDTGFVPANPDPAKQVRALALQPDGKLVVGSYHKGDNGNLPRNRVFRLLVDGSLDATLPPRGSGIEGGMDNVNGIVLQPNGDIVIGGELDVSDAVARMGLARIVGAERALVTPTPTFAPTPTPVASTPTPTSTSSATPSATVAETPSVTSSPTAPPTSLPTPTPTPTPARTAPPTPSAIASPTATAASSPTPGSPAAIACYRARTTRRFTPIPGVRLDDEFESIVARIVQATRFCNEASIDDGSGGSSVGVLVCHGLERALGEEWADPAGITITSRFGEQAVTFADESTERALCVPARGLRPESAIGAVPTQEESIGRVRCRRARTARMRPAPEIVLGDAFGTTRMRVRALRSVCAPVALDGDPSDASGLRACYDVARAPVQGGYRSREPIELEDELATETLAVRNGQRTVCVPAQRVR